MGSTDTVETMWAVLKREQDMEKGIKKNLHPVDLIKCSICSLKFIGIDKHLKKGGGHNGWNVIKDKENSLNLNKETVSFYTSFFVLCIRSSI